MHAIRTAVFGLAAAATVGACLLATPAQAEWHHGWHRRWWHGHWGWVPPAVVVAPRPYYYAPRYYAPPPVYYPPPVVYAPPAYYAPGVSFGVTVR